VSRRSYEIDFPQCLRVLCMYAFFWITGVIGVGDRLGYGSLWSLQWPRFGEAGLLLMHVGIKEDFLMRIFRTDGKLVCLKITRVAI